MKKILVSLALLSVLTNAKAESWVMPNTSGGEITITNQKCKLGNGEYGSLNHAYTWTNQVYLEGCWTIVDGNVHVLWDLKNGSQRRVYKPTDFTKKGSM